MSLAKNIAFAPIIFLIVACSPKINSLCDGYSTCTKINNVYILGGNDEQVEDARYGLQHASSSYSIWTGDEAPSGLIRLDETIPSPKTPRYELFWTLTYDDVRARSFEGAMGLRGSNSMLQKTKNSVGNERDKSRKHSLISHEICHQYASHLFGTVWGNDRVLPDSLNETAAVSCELPRYQDDRMSLFFDLHRRGRSIPWELFIRKHHPIKETSLIDDIRKSGLAGKSGIIKFSMDNDSDLGDKTAAFYGQSAALALFLNSKSCSNNLALGALLTTYDPEQSFNNWLVKNGRQSCLPETLEKFEHEINSFIASYVSRK